MQVYCPYCNSLNNLKIVCTDCKKSTMSSYTDKCNYNRIKNSTAILKDNLQNLYFLQVFLLFLFFLVHDIFFCLNLLHSSQDSYY